jgi:hypothetical protein
MYSVIIISYAEHHLSGTTMSTKWITHTSWTYFRLVWKIRLLALCYSWDTGFTCPGHALWVCFLNASLQLQGAVRKGPPMFLIVSYDILYIRDVSQIYIYIFQAMRLFIGDPIWTPYNRPHDHLPARYVFVSCLYCGHPYLSILV